MKLPTSAAKLSCLSVALFILTSCVPQKTETEIAQPVEPAAPVAKVEKQNQLPVQYQKPSYMVNTDNDESLEEVVEEVAIKVGASIRSTQGPQPLWDILKRLAALKKMSVSWASDVDQSVLVDVDISANDDFYGAVENLLRQVDYYHEMQGSTIVVKYKETRQFHVAMPFTKSLYETATGGNVLGSNEEASNIEGTIRLDSRGNEFDIWQNIQDNMDAILDTWSTTAATETPEAAAENVAEGGESDNSSTTSVTRQVSASGNKYTIDKPIGLITVHAPRPLLDKLEIYFQNLKRELYKQVSIEAKIIEVHLSDRSAIGLNWNLLLESLSVAGGQLLFGANRTHTQTDATANEDTWNTESSNETESTSGRDKTFDHLLVDSLTADTGSEGFENTITNLAESAATSTITSGVDITKVITSSGAAAISLAAFTFDSFLNAVKEQGQTTILSNPKLSVLNGQPALITVGRDVTYIDKIEVTTGTRESPGDKYSVETNRVLSGIGMALTANILDDNEIILNLVPVTSELQSLDYEKVGAGRVGLPIMNVREMSTTVKVRDGEMLVIGGLISNADEEAGTFLPGTSNLGFFKYLFGYEEKTSRKREMIILLKPRII